MTQEAPRSDLASQTVLYTIPGMDDVIVRRDEPYTVPGSSEQTMDLYYPAGAAGDARLPAVVLVLGYSAANRPATLARGVKDFGMMTSWARLIAASGMIAIVYSNRDPAADLDAVLRCLQTRAAELRLDAGRVAMLASSGNASLALSVLTGGGREYLRCAVMCYGFMLDSGAATWVADAARAYGFVPASGKTIGDVREDVPLLVARAGQDRFPGVNESIDAFVAGALARNIPLTLINHASGPHAFDMSDDSRATRSVVRQILTFLRTHLEEESDRP
jgi:dienelactone hydrolase